MERAVRTLALGLCFGFSSLAYAGPVNPPAGPVAPTDKPLAEVEPRIAVNAANTPGNVTNLFRITEPGSYYLTEDIARGPGGVFSVNVLSIKARDVTLDLNGFAVRGDQGIGNGIVISTPVSAEHRNVRVFNGSVISPGGLGIGSSNIRGVTLENIYVTGSTGDGIRLAADAVIRNCRVTNSGGNGIEVRDDALLTDCVIDTTGEQGVLAGIGPTISGCIVRRAGSTGIEIENDGTLERCQVDRSGVVVQPSSGYFVDGDATFVECKATNNPQHGFHFLGDASFTDCTAEGNADSGFFSGSSSQSTMVRCAATSNLRFGIVTEDGVIAECNASKNGLDGIRAGGPAVISRCLTEGNTNNGILMVGGGTVTSCISRENGSSGISANEGVVVSDCAAVQNTGNGISVSRATVIGCSSTGNGLNGLFGSGTFRSCTVQSNGQSGFSTNTNFVPVVIEDCLFEENTTAQISLGSPSVVKETTCNSGAVPSSPGIVVASSRCHIEGNTILRCTIGIEVTAILNLIIGNHAAGNSTDYSIVPNNMMGPIVTSATIGTNSNPSANYSY